MASHLFTVYFATFSAITPPVAVAAFAAASVAEGDATRIGWKAVKLGIAAFIIPFAFALNSEMLTYSFGSLSYWITVMSCVFAMAAMALAIEGFWTKRIPWWIRIIFALVAIVIMFDLSRVVDVICAALMVAIIVFMAVRAIQKKSKAKTLEA